MSLTTLDLLRHGAVEGQFCPGEGSDPALNASGWLSLRAWLREPPGWQAVISSPALRCAEFAREAADRLDLPLSFDPDWRELDFGDWSGRSWPDLYASEGAALMAFWRRPSGNPAPGGEDFRCFEQRVRTACGRALRDEEGRHVLIVTHAGPIRTLVRQVLGFPVTRLARLEAPLAGLSRLERWEREPPRLIFHGGRP